MCHDHYRSDSEEEWTPTPCRKSPGPLSPAPSPAQSPLPGQSTPTQPQLPGAGVSTRRRSKGKSPAAAKQRRVDTGETSSGDEADRWHDISEDDIAPHIPPFQPKRQVGPQLISTAVYSPLELFQLYFNMATIGTIVQNTNTYAEQRKSAGLKLKWTILTVKEFFGFLALVIYMGIVKLPAIVDYWSKRKGFNLEFPRSVMTCNRFRAISWNLHLSDPKEDEENKKKKGTGDFDRLFKIKPLYNSIVESCRTFFHPFRDLAIDERMVASKARTGLKQYMRDKPVKWGYKLFVLADSTNGYTWNFFVYEGKNAMCSGKGLSYDSVMSLTDFNLLGRGYKIYMDNFYSGPTLFTDLLSKHMLACGTIRTNRLGYPKTKMNDLHKRAERGTIKWYRREHLLFVRWKDTREVTVLSTMHQAYSGETVLRRMRDDEGKWSKKPVPVPDAIKDYNASMGGVDLSDALIGYYEVIHKTKKWYKTFFYHFTDIAIVNSFTLHQEMAKIQGENHLTQKKFREALYVELAARSKENLVPDEPEEPMAGPSATGPSATVQTEACLPAYYSTDATAGRKRCVHCTQKTPVYCTRCQVSLCFVSTRNCYKEWHDKGKDD